MKTCLKCNLSKNLNEFSKDINRLDGLFPYCKECKKTYQKIYYKINKNILLAEQKKYYKSNRSQILVRTAEYCKVNKDKKKKYDKIYTEKNREKRKQYRRQYFSNEMNREKKREYDRKYRLSQNKHLLREYHASYKRNRRRHDPLFKFICNARTRIYKIFIGIDKKISSGELLGCSLEQAKKHIEAMFQSGMGWNNYGKWHIDHKMPLSKANSIEELEKLCHYSNLQPLWAKDNLKKGNK